MLKKTRPILSWDDFLTKKTGWLFWEESYGKKLMRWEMAARTDNLSSPFCLKSYLTQEVNYYHHAQRWWGPINFFNKLWAWCFHEINHKETMLLTYQATHPASDSIHSSVANEDTIAAAQYGGWSPMVRKRTFSPHIPYFRSNSNKNDNLFIIQPCQLL